MCGYHAARAVLKAEGNKFHDRGFSEFAKDL
jgi:hypothetical protein